MKQSRDKAGFTLIELLVVIAIIGILASVVLSSISSARESAQYTKVAGDLRATELAYQMLRNQHGCWPLESNRSGCVSYAGAGMTIATMINTNTFGISQYLNTPPSWPFSTADWFYDNDGDARGDCVGGTSGVNIIKSSVTYEQFRVMNTIFDRSEDPATANGRNCGKITWDGSGISSVGNLFFVLSRGQQ